jgi:hypothetical protein
VSYPLPRAHCPACLRRVPILAPREGTRNRPPDTHWRYRFHRPEGRRCPGSGQHVLPRYMPPELSTSSSTP